MYFSVATTVSHALNPREPNLLVGLGCGRAPGRARRAAWSGIPSQSCCSLACGADAKPLRGHARDMCEGGSAMGGYLPLAPGVSSVRYPIRERTFKYVATVQSVTDETYQEPTL